MKATILLILLTFTANAQNWELLHKPEEDRYVDILSYQNSAYLLVYQAGLIKLYQTTDDGSTWKRIIEREDKEDIVKNFTLASDVIDNGFVFIPVGSEGEIIKVKTNPNVLANMKIETENIVNSLDMLDESNGVASTDIELFVTNDSWVTSSKYNVSNIQSVAITELSISYITYSEENGNMYYRSIDNGKSWDSTKVDELIPEKIYFTNENRGFIVGKKVVQEDADVYSYYDMIYMTTDNGITWSKVLENKKEEYTELFDIEFKNNIGIASGLTKSIYTSYDNGLNWEKQSLGELETNGFLLTVCGFLNDKFLLGIRNEGIYSMTDPTLSIESGLEENDFGFSINEGIIKFKDDKIKNYKIVNLNGQVIMNGIARESILIESLENSVYFLAIDGIKTFKFINVD